VSFYPQNLPNFRRKKQSRTDSPIKHAKYFLRDHLTHLRKILAGRPQEVIEAWYRILGKKYNGMTQAVGLRDGVLSIKVRNASLYAVLKQSSQKELISQIHSAVPGAKIKEIRFLLG
jgi:Protein of unknown function (DUF721).